MVLLAFFQAPTRALDAIPEDYRHAAAVGAILALPLAAWLFSRSSNNKPQPDTQVRLPVVLPSALPLLGNLLEVIKYKDSRHDWFTRLGEQYQGRPFQFTMPGRPPITVIYTPELVEDALKTHFDAVPKGPVQRENFRDVLGHGIFAVDGAEWIHQRKTASNLFTARTLRDSMTENMRKYTVVLQRILERACVGREEVDMHRLLNRFTIEAFAKMGFGVDLNCLEADEDHAFQNAFDSAQRVFVGRVQRPVWFWKLQRLLGVGNEAQLKEDLAIIGEVVLDIVAQTLAQRQSTKENAAGQGNIVTLFLDRFDGSTTEKPSAKYLRDIVVNFILAGRDTTAQALTWCIYNLSQHPEVVAKIRDELKCVLPAFVRGKGTEPPKMEDVQQLTYLDAVLKETLRLHPSVPLIPKSLAKDVVFSDGTLMRGGTVLTISAYAMARMEFVWGPDAKQFNPDRWIDHTTGKQISVSAFKFVAFNAGPRMCLGMNLAMLEMKIVLASVVSRFDIALVPGQQVTYDNSMTLPVKDGLRVRVSAVAAEAA